MLGRMLWWSSAVASYIAIVGLGSLAVKLYRRRPYGEPEPNRADQFAGFWLAAAKGTVVAAFLVGAIDRYVLTYARQLPWAAEQAKTSQALVWNEQYRPADRIWSAPPVQMFVAHVRTMGVDGPAMPRSRGCRVRARPRADSSHPAAAARPARPGRPSTPPPPTSSRSSTRP